MTDDKKQHPSPKDFKPRSKFDADDTERLKKWQTLIDQKIRDMIGDGNVSHLAGAGQPLRLNLDGEFTPDELRVAYKIMRDNDVVPTWMALRYVLDDKQAKIRRQLHAYHTAYQQRLQEATQKASALLERDARLRWQSALTKIRQDIETYNKELLDYNLSVPPQIGQRRPMSFDEELLNVSKNPETDN